VVRTNSNAKADSLQLISVDYWGIPHVLVLL